MRPQDQTNEQWLADYNRKPDMSLTMKEEAGDFTPAPAGNHVAICYAVIDLGTQHNDAFNYEGKAIPASDKPQVLIQWELPNEQVEIDGESKPASVSCFYNAYFYENAKLRKHLEAWRTRAFTQEELLGFDISALLGKPCMVSVVHTDKGKAKVSGVAAMPKGMNVPDVTNTMMSFDLDNYDQAVFDAVSEGIQNIIKKSPEWQALNKPAEGFRDTAAEQGHDQAPDFADDDIPF